MVTRLDAASKKSKQLSGGMKRRLSVAMVCVGSPDILILGECINFLLDRIVDVSCRSANHRIGSIVMTTSMRCILYNCVIEIEHVMLQSCEVT